MNKPDNNYSRLNRKRGRNRSDKILNILIAVVVLAIIITASIIFLGGEDNDKADVKSPDTAEEENNNDDLASENADETDNNDSTNENDDADQSTDNSDESGTDEETEETDETDVEEDRGVVKYESSNDPVVDRNNHPDSDWSQLEQRKQVTMYRYMIRTLQIGMKKSPQFHMQQTCLKMH